MAREAGFTVSLRPQEFASSLTDNDNGKHQAFLIGWSGRVDPDGNMHQNQTCKGSLNATHACDERIDALLNRAREVSDVDQRRALYRGGHRPLHGPAQHRLHLPPELHHRVPPELEGLQGGPGRPHPRQGDVLELTPRRG